MMNRFHVVMTAAIWTGFFSVVVSGAADAGFVQNGEFDEQNADGEFSGWDTNSLFAAPTGNADSVGNFAVFSDSQLGIFGPFGVQIQQSIVIPQGAVSLSFDYSFGSNALSESSSIPDGFQASLLDLSSFPPSGMFAAGNDPVLQPAFFSVDDRGDALSGVGVSVTQAAVGLRDDWSRVSVDLSSLPESDLLLEFALFDGTDSNVQSTVLLDNVVIQASTGVIPEPGALVIWLLMVGTVGCFAAYRQRSIRTACDTACPPEPKLPSVIQ